MEKKAKIKQEEIEAELRALQVLEKRNKAFRILYDTVLEIEGAREEQVFSILSRNLRKLCKARYAVLASYDMENNQLKPESMDVAGNIQNSVKNFPQRPAELNQLLVKQIKRYPIFECRNHNMCLPNCCPEILLYNKTPEKNGRCYRVASVRENQILALGMIQMPANGSLKLKDLVDAYLSLAGMIIQRVISERELKKAHLQNEQLLHAITSILVGLEADGTVNRWNEGAYETFGITPEQAEGKKLFELGIKWDSEQILDCIENCRATEQASRLRDFYFIRPHGQSGYLNITVNSYSVHSREETGFLFLAEDVTERKLAEENLNLERRQLLSIFDSTNEPIYISDPSTYELIYANKALRDLFGENICGRKCHEVLQGFEEPCRFCTNDRIFGDNSGKPYIWEFQNKKTGRWYRCIDRAVRWPDGRLVRYEMALDITDRIKVEKEKEKIQKQLMQSQKIEAIGTLAGGIAHDFNNLLTAILGYTELTLLSVDEDNPLHKNLKNIDNSAKRAAELTSQLLAFSRKQPMKYISLDLNHTIKDVLNLLRRLISENIVIETSLESDLRKVQADPVRLEQIIINLSVNARDAMPDGGTLSIGTSNAPAEIAPKNRNDDLISSSFVILTVKDNGSGMDKETLRHIFDPFFSTKRVGEGSGLGLSVVYGIVEQHGGWIDVKSQIGKGTSFNVYLPSAENCQENSQRSNPGIQAHSSNHETILLVEDELSVRNFAKAVLVQNGYNVIEAEDAEEALSLHDRKEQKFDMLFSDVVLPGKNGIELTDTLRKRNPELPVLLCSGYTDEKSQWKIIQKRGIEFLHKPYSMKNLLQSIRKVLNNKAA